jgi:tetratricopeptide (TPR) repeat protein
MRKSLSFLLLFSCLTLAHCKSQEKKTAYDQKAIELNNKAVEFIKVDDYDSALLYLDSAIHIDTTYYFAYANKCTIYCSLKDFKKALLASQMVTIVKPDLAEGWTFTGMLHDWLDDTANARICYEKSIEIFDERISNPDTQKFLEANRRNRAISLILIGKEETGRNELKKLKKEYPNDKLVVEFLQLSKEEYLEEQFAEH